MAAKKNSRIQPAAVAKEPVPVEAARLSLWQLVAAELRGSPALCVAVVFLILTCFSISAVVQFHDDMEMGAIREPTSSIFLAAVTLTLFGSYWRQRRGQT